MDARIITFGDIEIEEQNFYRYKSPAVLQDVNTDNILVSNKISSDEKHNYKSLVGFFYSDHKIES